MTDPEGKVEFQVGDRKLIAFFGLRAEKEVERHFDMPFGKAIRSMMPAMSAENITDPAKLAAAAEQVRLSDLAKLFEFALLKHQPEIKEREIEDIVDEIGLERAAEILAETVASAMSAGDASEDREAPNPRKAAKSAKPIG